LNRENVDLSVVPDVCGRENADKPVDETECTISDRAYHIGYPIINNGI
jgi:hypothetical protein